MNEDIVVGLLVVTALFACWLGYRQGRATGWELSKLARETEERDPGYILHLLRKRGLYPDQDLWTEVDRQRDLYRRLAAVSDGEADATAVVREFLLMGGQAPFGTYRVSETIGVPSAPSPVGQDGEGAPGALTEKKGGGAEP